MKPWMALSVVVSLCGCVSDPAPRVRCKGPWQELPRVSGTASAAETESKARDSKKVGQTRGQLDSKRGADTALVGVADKIPRAARQLFGEKTLGGTSEIGADLSEVRHGR